jgi:hypothetical protein
MLAQQEDPPRDANGPAGKPLTEKEQLANFDRVETTWSQYRDAMSAASASRVSNAFVRVRRTSISAGAGR